MAWIASIIAFFVALSAFDDGWIALCCAMPVFFVVSQTRRGAKERSTIQLLSQKLDQQQASLFALQRRIELLEANPPPAPIAQAELASPLASPLAAPVLEPEAPAPAPLETQPSLWDEAPAWSADTSEQAYAASAAVETPAPVALPPVQPSSPALEDQWFDQSPDPFHRAFQAARDWLFGGNTVARVGVLVLVVGVALLVKYAADHAYFPLELRLATAAVIGLGLAVIGFRVRAQRPEFSLALQGGGVASTYLVVFFAYRTYGLIPASLTFGLLFVLGAAHVTLAVVQNAQSLAMVGMFGGFLAPVLASSGGGNHIALFSYYALLNGGIFAIAWFRPFRWLNLLGFTCTFGIGTAWGVLRYQPEQVWSTGAFLFLFFVYYSLASVLFAWRQTDQRKGFIHSTLTFGTPLAVFGLMTALLRPYPYGIALGTSAMGGYYILLATFLWRRAPDILRAQVEAFVAVGIGFVTLAIPFALDDHHITGVAWAAEATGLYWVGLRQQRTRLRMFGYLLLAISMVTVFLARVDHAASTLLLARTVLAIAAFTFSILTVRYADKLSPDEGRLAQQLWLAGLVAWLLALHAGLERYVPVPYQKATALSLAAMTAGALELLGTAQRWQPGRWMARSVAPVMVCWLLPGVVDGHPLERQTWLGFTLSFAISLWVGQRAELSQADEPPQEMASPDWLMPYYTCLAWIAAILVVWEAGYVVALAVPTPPAWTHASRLAAALLMGFVFYAWIERAAWPFTRDPALFRLFTVVTLVAGAALYCLGLGLGSDGSIAPLPFLPIANPLDLTSAITWMFGLKLALVHFERRLPPSVIWGFGIAAFFWLNTALVRALCNWNDVTYEPNAIFNTPIIQSSLSIFWTLLGLAAMVLASHKRTRSLWMTGAALLTTVVAKLFLSDLATLSTGIKIMTFLAVGALLIVVGYVAPVPPAARPAKLDEAS